jgi:hypothetical protein
MNKALAAAHAARLRMKEAGIEPERLSPIERARRFPASLRFAINAKCWDCQGGDADPNPRQRIRDCEIIECPLHPVRPGRGGRGEEGSSDSAVESIELAPENEELS